MEKYTLEDIEKFIIDYKNSLEPEPNNLIMTEEARAQYQQFLFEQQKRNILEKHFIKAKSGSVEEQKKFIEDMTPVLDDFYSSKETDKTRKSF